MLINLFTKIFGWLWNNFNVWFSYLWKTWNWGLVFFLGFVLGPIEWLIEIIRGAIYGMTFGVDQITSHLQSSGAISNLQSSWGHTLYYGEVLNNIFPIWVLISSICLLTAATVFAIVVRVIIRFIPGIEAAGFGVKIGGN